MSALDEMSGIEKAATVLNVLSKPLASRLLQLFSPDDLKKITSITGELKPISTAEFSRLIEEFASQFSDGLQMLGDPREISGLLETVLTPEQVATISSSAPITQKTPVWTDSSFSNQEVLEPLIEQEHPQTVAFILSKTGTELSAKIIALMNENKRNDIMHRMLEIKPIQAEILSVVEDHFRVNFIENDSSSKGKESRSRMAGIINNLDKVQADEFLEELALEDPEEAEELKKLLFAFDDIPSLTVKDRLVLFDNVETDLSILALNGATGEIREMILSSFGTRARKMVESELANSQDRDPAEIDQARKTIARIALDLSANGDITIVLPDQED